MKRSQGNNAAVFCRKKQKTRLKENFETSIMI